MGDALAMCAKHADEHASIHHTVTERHEQAILNIMQREMKDGFVTGHYTPDFALSFKGPMPNTWARSTFLIMEKETLEFPCTITVQVPRKDPESIVNRTISAIASAGLHVYHYTIRSSITLMHPDVRTTQRRQVRRQHRPHH